MFSFKNSYQPLLSSTESEAEVGSTGKVEVHLPPQGGRRSRAWIGLICISIILLVLNITQVILGLNLHQQQIPITNVELPLEHGLRTIRSMRLPGLGHTKFVSENATVASEVWDSIEAGHGVVAFDTAYAESYGLPATDEHPDGSGRLVYTIEAYHSMHCVKTIRYHYLKLLQGEPVDFAVDHDLHCFDALRQTIMCTADATLLYTTLETTGGNQLRWCRSWDALREYATKHTACFHDAPSALPVWRQCDNGDDGLPRGSLLG